MYERYLHRRARGDGTLTNSLDLVIQLNSNFQGEKFEKKIKKKR